MTPKHDEAEGKSHQVISSPQGLGLARLHHVHVPEMFLGLSLHWPHSESSLEAKEAVASLVLRLHSFPSQTLITRKRKKESECIQVEMVGVHLEEFSQKEKDR